MNYQLRSVRKESDMWKRRVIKKKAVTLIKLRYWRMISVCFLIALLTNTYSISTSFLFLQIPFVSQGGDATFSLGIPNSEALIDTVSHLLPDTYLSAFFSGSWDRISAVLIDLFSANLSVFFASIRTLSVMITEDPGPAVAFLILGVIFAVIYQLFVNNILVIGERRFFLETRNYRQTPISKIFYLFKLRYVRHPAWVMFCRSLFQGLWNLTIVGGLIKHYEYILIPYILAENPQASRKDVFYLSKQLMHHNKWKFFLFDLSFLGWQILSLFTFGILNFLFVNPYMAASRAELYALLRRNYVLSRSPRYEVLSDSYLEHVPSEDELLISKALYDDSQGPYTKISYFAPEQYPVFLFSLQPPLRAVRTPVKVERKYDVLSYLLLFITFSVFGWLLQASIQLMAEGALIREHFLAGPWLPFYGAYGILVLLLLRRLNKKPVFVFVLSVILAALMEYFLNASYETLTGTTLNDYSDFFLNLNGRIYLGGSIIYAILGCAFLYYLAPRWTEFYMKLGRTKRTLLCALLYVLFIIDVTVSSLQLIFG